MCQEEQSFLGRVKDKSGEIDKAPGIGYSQARNERQRKPRARQGQELNWEWTAGVNGSANQECAGGLV